MQRNRSRLLLSILTVLSFQAADNSTIFLSLPCGTVSPVGLFELLLLWGQLSHTAIQTDPGKSSMPTAQLSAAVSAPACAAQRLMSGNRGARCPVYHDSRLAAPAAEAPSQVTTVLTLTANSPRGPRGVRYMLDGMPEVAD